MHKATPPQRWYHVWRARPAPAFDAADQGTAFGLEMSLGDSLYDAPAPRAAAKAPGPRWLPRLGRRASHG
jgi:hypothetical protein